MGGQDLLDMNPLLDMFKKSAATIAFEMAYKIGSALMMLCTKAGLVCWGGQGLVTKLFRYCRKEGPGR